MEVTFGGANRQLFEGYVEYRRAQGYSFGKQTLYKVRELSEFLDSRPASERVLTKELVDEFCEAREGCASNSSQRGRISLCRQFGLYLTTLGVGCYVVPAQLPRANSKFVPRIITEEEMERVIAAADSVGDRFPRQARSSRSGLVYRALIRMLWGCGLRIGEALSLRLSDVDVPSGAITVTAAKGNKSRTVPMSRSLAACMHAYWDSMCFDAEPRDAWFFPSDSGGMRNQSAVGVTVKKLMLAAGVTTDGRSAPRVHDIRHSYAVRALEKMDSEGVDIYCSLPLLSSVMGHADIKSTEYYLRITGPAMEAIAERMAPAYASVFPEVGDA